MFAEFSLLCLRILLLRLWFYYSSALSYFSCLKSPWNWGISGWFWFFRGLVGPGKDAIIPIRVIVTEIACVYRRGTGVFSDRRPDLEIPWAMSHPDSNSTVLQGHTQRAEKEMLPLYSQGCVPGACLYLQPLWVPWTFPQYWIDLSKPQLSLVRGDTTC